MTEQKPAESAVVIQMATSHRLRLSNQILAQMQKKGFTPYDYAELQLGFDLPPDWPAAADEELTLAQLVVLAVKLNMQIVITDLDMEARKPEGGE